eukprot:TRINITY_DN1617_c0_g3_i2.p1 TRINITY_DN1617_c0_g3~~TRINITY_DN1617_c0_g3_i2.p1  ORF type:complete len:309 (+),score=43.48 TRINITY_DN1617_c0_g3_i2:68-928(+)
MRPRILRTLIILASILILLSLPMYTRGEETKEERGSKAEQEGEEADDPKHRAAVLIILTCLVATTMLFDFIKDKVNEVLASSPTMPTNNIKEKLHSILCSPTPSSLCSFIRKMHLAHALSFLPCPQIAKGVFEVVVDSLWEEMTVLGFVGLLSFLLVRTNVLTSLSENQFGDPEYLPEILETMHMLLFLVMVIFIVQALFLVHIGQVVERRWRKFEKRSAELVEVQHEVDDALEYTTEWPVVGRFFTRLISDLGELEKELEYGTVTRDKRTMGQSILIGLDELTLR